MLKKIKDSFNEIFGDLGPGLLADVYFALIFFTLSFLGVMFVKLLFFIFY